MEPTIASQVTGLVAVLAVAVLIHRLTPSGRPSRPDLLDRIFATVIVWSSWRPSWWRAHRVDEWLHTEDGRRTWYKAASRSPGHTGVMRIEHATVTAHATVAQAGGAGGGGGGGGGVHTFDDPAFWEEAPDGR